MVRTGQLMIPREKDEFWDHPKRTRGRGTGRKEVYLLGDLSSRVEQNGNIHGSLEIKQTNDNGNSLKEL